MKDVDDRDILEQARRTLLNVDMCSDQKSRLEILIRIFTAHKAALRSLEITRLEAQRQQLIDLFGENRPKPGDDYYTIPIEWLSNRLVVLQAALDKLKDGV